MGHTWRRLFVPCLTEAVCTMPYGGCLYHALRRLFVPCLTEAVCTMPYGGCLHHALRRLFESCLTEAVCAVPGTFQGRKGQGLQHSQLQLCGFLFSFLCKFFFYIFARQNTAQDFLKPVKKRLIVSPQELTRDEECLNRMCKISP